MKRPRSPDKGLGLVSFKARFEKRIAKLTEDAEKFAFLLNCLEKYEAAHYMCEVLENSGVSFASVWQKLEVRFYKKRLDFEGHISKAFRMKKSGYIQTSSYENNGRSYPLVWDKYQILAPVDFFDPI